MVVLEQENDQEDDQDQYENATTDVHVQPPWSQERVLNTRSAEKITQPCGNVHLEAVQRRNPRTAPVVERS
jgi:hypothetical protein